jgi:hypothetical protein
MIRKSSNDLGNGRMAETEAGRSPLFTIMWIGCGVTVALLWLSHRPLKAPIPTGQPESASAVENKVQSPAEASANQSQLSTTEVSSPTPDTGRLPGIRQARVKPEPPPAAPRPEPSAYTRGLAERLSRLDLSRGVITPEQALAWKENYNKLVSQGPQAVPAIRELLEQNINIDFASMQSADLIGASSLRMALFDALRQIGGQDAVDVTLQTMQTTTDPREIAALAGDLQSMAPGQYTDAALAAARGMLANIGNNPGQVDMGPAFEVLQKFGGPGVASDLEQASTKWNYYAPIALSALPDGAGIASLERMADNANGAYSGSSRVALQLLAGMASQYPAAADALMNEVRNNNVPDSAWLGIASALSGEQMYYGQGYPGTITPPPAASDPKSFHLAYNNQNFYSLNTSSSWTPDQIQQQLALINQIANANPSASTALANVRNTLAGKAK